MADETRSSPGTDPGDPAFDRKGQDAVEGRDGEDGKAEGTGPAAGPHATAPLTSDTATPGTGALPSGGADDEADPGVG